MKLVTQGIGVAEPLARRLPLIAHQMSIGQSWAATIGFAVTRDHALLSAGRNTHHNHRLEKSLDTMQRIYREVYILYPRGVRTGGPEALHQLAAALRELGTPAFLVPLPGTANTPRVPEYKAYDVPEAEKVADLLGNAVVAPEGYYFHLTKYRHADRFCWWLSIDFSQLYRSERRLITMPATTLRNRIHRSAHRVISAGQAAVRPIAFRLPVYHLTQSAFAWAFLYSRADVVPSMLSDYVVLPAQQQGTIPDRKSKQIAYNFAKGGDLVQQVINSRTINADWVAITKMSRPEVFQTLQSSTIYLDLGYQPGKDRLPREAAANGAITLIARRGAGGFYLDFPLPHDHKITIDKNIITSVTAAIEAVWRDSDHEYGRQAKFRSNIENEKKIFISETRRIFVEGKLGSDFED